MTSIPDILRLGTRKSQLAMIQAETVAQLLRQSLPGLRVELVPISTSGDRAKEARLADIGGKGLFVKELEEALLEGTVDFAVHSAKDMPAVLPPGLILAAALPREDVRDALVCHTASTIDALPEGACVGTSSPRRRAQLLRLRPDLEIIDFRGNVPTRLKKLKDGVADATLLAMAGLKRLGIFDARCMHPIESGSLLPAGGQAAIAVECREDAPDVTSALQTIGDMRCLREITAERAMLEVLEGSCTTPVAAHATLKEEQITLNAMLFSPDGQKTIEVQETGSASEARTVGQRAGERLVMQDTHGLRYG